jgi:hypothetical protein
MTTKWSERPSGGPLRYLLSYTKFAVSLAVFLRIRFFWNMTLFRWVWVSRRLEETWCPRRQRLWGPKTDIIWKWHVLTWIVCLVWKWLIQGSWYNFYFSSTVVLFIYFWVKCVNYKIQNVYELTFACRLTTGIYCMSHKVRLGVPDTKKD